MSHDHIAASLVAVGLFMLSAASAVAGTVLATDVPASVIITLGLFLAGILVTVLGWMAVTLFSVNGDTKAMRSDMTNTTGDIADIKSRLDALEHPQRRRIEDRVAALEHLDP